MSKLTKQQIDFHLRYCEKDSQFIETMFEIAFGDDAINKDYSRREVIVKLQEYCEDSYRYEVMCEIHDKVKVDPESVMMNNLMHNLKGNKD